MKQEYSYLLRAVERLFGRKTEEVKEELQNYNWSDILYQSVLHRILPVIYYDLLKGGLTAAINNTLYKHIKSFVDLSGYHNRILLEQAALVASEAKKQNLEILILKGPVLAEYLYNDPGMRTFGDVDILIERNSLSKVKDMLRKCGFVQGSYDKTQEFVKPADRREIIERELHTHETVEFHKITEDAYRTDLVIDVNHALSWNGAGGNEDTKLSVSDFMKTQCLYSRSGMSIPGPSPEMLFIHTCLHLYSEAVLFCWQYSWHKNFGDLELRKYIDVGLFFLREICWDTVRTDIIRYGIIEPVSYVLTQFKQLFPEIRVPEALTGDIGDDNDTGYYYTCKGEKKAWTLPIRERVFNQAARKEDVEAHTVSGDMLIKKQ